MTEKNISMGMAAKEHVDEMLLYLNDDEIVREARKILEQPSDSAWFDSELWETHVTAFAYTELSGTDVMGESNHYAALERLENVARAYRGDDVEMAERVERSSFGHWTYSRFECLKVRVLDLVYEGGYDDNEGWTEDQYEVTPEFVELLAMREELREYPLLDEDDYMERESALRGEWSSESADELRAEYARALENRSEPDAVVAEILEVEQELGDGWTWMLAHVCERAMMNYSIEESGYFKDEDLAEAWRETLEWEVTREREKRAEARGEVAMIGRDGSLKV